jgi:glycosyltransferase involved in cell wall biosynthesis
MSELSIVIPVVNDLAELLETLRSIRDTTLGRCVDVIVIDDESRIPVTISNFTMPVRVFRNRHRVGAAACRHIGILHAKNSHVFLCDSHMRFDRYWYHAALIYTGTLPNSLFCATMRGFDSEFPAFSPPRSEYHGADLVIRGPKHTLEGVWTRVRPDGANLSCLMGACYLIPRKWYLKHGGLNFLRGWGCEEQMLSLKAWMSGTTIKLMRDCVVWHKFRTKREDPPYIIETWTQAYNKLFIVMTMFPHDLWPVMTEALSSIPDFDRAEAQIKADWHLVVTERAKNKIDLKYDIHWFAKEFGIEL